MEDNRGGRPKISEYWEVRVGELAEDKDETGKQLTAGEIYRRILAEAKRVSRHDYPRLQTIKARLAKRRRIEPMVRALDAPFQWSHSMLDGILPWEVAAAGLELLARRDERGLGRPSNRLVAGYYRVLLAAPDLDRNRVEERAQILANAEFMRQDPRRGLA